MVGAAALVLGVVLLVVTVYSLNRPKGRSAGRTTGSVTVSTPAPSSGSTPTPTPTKSSAAPSTSASSTPVTTPSTATVAKVPLIVANNTGRVGLAATAAARFEAKGWQVSDTQNFEGDILSTCAYYDPSNPANQAAAIELQKEFPAIKRVKERFDGLPTGPIVVMLTTDYS
jgi:hypothetical protein